MKLFTFFTACCIPFFLYSQPSLLEVKEIPLNNELTYYQFFHEENDRYGLLVRETNAITETPVLRYYQLGTTLAVKSQGVFPLDRDVEVVMAKENTYNIFILLKKERGGYEILQLDKFASEFEQTDIEVPSSMEISHFLATDQALFIGGITKGKTTAYKLRLNSKKFQVLFHHLNQQTKINALQYHKDVGVVSFLMEKSRDFSIDHYLVNQHHANGDLLYTASVTLPINYRAGEAKLVVLNQKNCMLLGTYSQAVIAKENAMGFFSIKLKEKEVVGSRFYNLGRVDNYFAFIPQKKELKLKKRIEKAAVKNKSIKTGINIVLDEPQITEGRVLLEGSSFYKIKNTDKTLSFEYLNTFLACFDQKGRLLWNNTMVYPNEHLKTSSPFLLTEACLINGEAFFIQKQQYIYRSKIVHSRERDPNVNHTYLKDGFLSTDYKNVFYDQHMSLNDNGLLLYFGIREKTPKNNILNSQLYFFIEKIEAVPRPLLSKEIN